MELNEFSNEFDVLYNSITSNQAPGLDEYEKSVFLTNGQTDVLRSYFNARENKPQQGFDDSRKRQIDFSSLMKNKTLDVYPTTYKFDNRSITYRMPNDLLLFINESCSDSKYRYVVIPISYEEYDRLMLKPYQYPIKRGVWRLIVNSGIPTTGVADITDTSHISILNSTTKEVTFTIQPIADNIETAMDENGFPLSFSGVGYAPTFIETPTSVNIVCRIYNKINNTSLYWSGFLNRKDAPYYDKLNSYVGDLGGGGDSSFPAISGEQLQSSGAITVIAPPATPLIELIGRVNPESLKYTVRYLRKPKPIVLTNLGDGLSIQGVNTESPCELDESLHQEILQRAVELAKAAYLGDLQSQIALGQASKTDIGIVPQSR